MMMRGLALHASVLVAALVMSATSAKALTMKECSAKYKDAKQANTLNGQDWKAFRAAQCGAAAKTDAAAGPRGCSVKVKVRISPMAPR